MIKNLILHGLIIGVLIPVISFLILYGTFYFLETQGWVSTKGFSPYFRERTIGIVAIGLNAIPLNKAFKSKMTNLMRGIVIPTFIFIILWLVFFGNLIL